MRFIPYIIAGAAAGIIWPFPQSMGYSLLFCLTLIGFEELLKRMDNDPR